MLQHVVGKHDVDGDGNPAGGEDILRLCELADDLLEIVRWAQQELPMDRQQEIEKKLWLAERGR